MWPVPSSIDELLTLLDLETIDDCLFRGRQPETSLQRVFGGQVASQALVAAARTTDADRVVHSLHAYFLRPGDTRVPIVYDVERTRDGRAFSTRRVVARQHGRSIFYMSASFHLAEDGLDHQDPMPEVAAPEDCPELGDVLAGLTGRPRDEWDREWAALDVRYAGDSRQGGALHDDAHPALARVWLKAAGPIGAGPGAARGRARLRLRPDAALGRRGAARHLHRRPAAGARLAGPRDVVPPAAAGRRVAALRPGVAERLRRSGLRHRPAVHRRTGG